MEVTKRVQLSRPIKTHTGLADAVVIREPTGAEIFTIGEPQTWVRAESGVALIDNWDAIKAYADKLIVEPDPVLTLAQIAPLDAIKVKETIVGFFHPEAKATPT